MKPSYVCALILFATMAACSPVPCVAFQTDRVPRKSQLDPWDIEVLQLDGVSKELQISKQQVHQWNQIAEDAYSDIRQYGNRLEDLRSKGATDQERLAFAEKEQMKPHEREEARILAMLTAPQRRRLRQITFQFNGALLLAYPTAAQEMGISEKQRRRIASKLDDYQRYEDRLQREEWEADDKTWVVHADLKRLNARDRKEYDRLTGERLTAQGSRKDEVLERLYELEKKAGRKQVTTKETRDQTIKRLNTLAVHNWKARLQRRRALSRDILAQLTKAQRGKWKAWIGRVFAFKAPTTLVA